MSKRMFRMSRDQDIIVPGPPDPNANSKGSRSRYLIDKNKDHSPVFHYDKPHSFGAEKGVMIGKKQHEAVGGGVVDKNKDHSPLAHLYNPEKVTIGGKSYHHRYNNINFKNLVNPIASNYDSKGNLDLAQKGKKVNAARTKSLNVLNSNPENTSFQSSGGRYGSVLGHEALNIV